MVERGGNPVGENQAKDRRTQRTEALLRGALADLTREKPYEDIVVKEILHRANVGRSTFYTHFCGKDELLLSCIHETLRSAQPSAAGRAPTKLYESIGWFSRPVFDHIERHRRGGKAAAGPRGQRAMHEHLQRAITELVEDEIRTALGRGNRTGRHPSPELLVRWIASTFILVLNWWVESDSPLPASQADSLFRSLIEPALAGALG
jgi:AcrR family transcriptional regulator